MKTVCTRILTWKIYKIPLYSKVLIVITPYYSYQKEVNMGWIGWAVKKGIEYKRQGTLDDVIDAFPVICVEAEVKPYTIGSDIKRISGKVYRLTGEEMETTNGLNMFLTSEEYSKAHGIDFVNDSVYNNAIRSEALYVFKETLNRLPNLNKSTFGIYIARKTGGSVMYIPAFVTDKDGRFVIKNGNLLYSKSVGMLSGEKLDQIPRDSDSWNKNMKYEMFRRALFAYKLSQELRGYDGVSLEKAFGRFKEAHPTGEVSY